MVNHLLIAQTAGQELNWMTQVDWTLPFLTICAALSVLWLGHRLSKGARFGKKGATPGGRDLDFDLEIARLETQPPVAIAQAKAGLVHIRGVLKSAQGSLGGPSDRARVWYNQVDGPRDAAVGVELCLLADESGQVALEELGQARVIAPIEGPEPRFRCLSLGDEVELLGEFLPEKVQKSEENAHEAIYGVVGRARTFQLRLLKRPEQNTHSQRPAQEG